MNEHIAVATGAHNLVEPANVVEFIKASFRALHVNKGALSLDTLGSTDMSTWLLNSSDTIIDHLNEIANAKPRRRFEI
jgi:hypothetical protein